MTREPEPEPLEHSGPPGVPEEEWQVPPPEPGMPVSEREPQPEEQSEPSAPWGQSSEQVHSVRGLWAWEPERPESAEPWGQPERAGE